MYLDIIHYVMSMSGGPAGFIHNAAPGCFSTRLPLASNLHRIDLDRCYVSSYLFTSYILLFLYESCPSSDIPLSLFIQKHALFTQSDLLESVI